MRKKAAVLTVLSGVLLLMAQRSFAEQDTKLLTIVGLGDSTTAGTPGFFSPSEEPPAGAGNPESQYAYWMEKMHPDWRVLNRGVRGQRSDQILRRFDREVAVQHPDVVIVLAGVNDLHQGYEPSEVIRNLAALYQKVSEIKARLVVATILPYDLSSPEVQKNLEEVNAWIRAYAKKNPVGFCDTFSLLQDPGQPHHLIGSPDGIHPDVSGYRRMGEAFVPVIEDLVNS